MIRWQCQCTLLPPSLSSAVCPTMVGQTSIRRTRLWLPCQCHQDLVNHKTTSPSIRHVCRQWNSGVEGRPHLGDPLGSQEYTYLFVKGKVKEWCNELEKLASIAETQPHAVYAAITHGLAGKCNYLSRTTSDIGERLDPLETMLRTKVIPALTGRPPGLPPSDAERTILALPARLGGIGACDPSSALPTSSLLLSK